ncbi:dehydratase, partial [Pseudonocardia sp. MCCB 268]|nr:dehydratase [Pseudonocardia cytotoxica]
MEINNRVGMRQTRGGQVFRSTDGRSPKTDVVNFLRADGKLDRILRHEHYAEQTRFGERLVQGSLSVSPSSPKLISSGPADQARLRSGRDALPETQVHIDDTIYATAEVVANRRTAAT